MSDEQGFPAGAGRIVPAPIMLALRRMEMPERIADPEAIADWMWAKHESDSVDMEMADLQRRRAEERSKALAEALRRLIDAVEREYGEQPGVPELVAAKALLK